MRLLRKAPKFRLNQQKIRLNPRTRITARPLSLHQIQSNALIPIKSKA
jgi:hypothetical protein